MYYVCMICICMHVCMCMYVEYVSTDDVRHMMMRSRTSNARTGEDCSYDECFSRTNQSPQEE